MNEITLKKIVSIFLKTNPQNICSSSIIDNSVIQGSILFHRMISRINDYYKIEISNYETIKTYGDLLKQVKLKYEK